MGAPDETYDLPLPASRAQPFSLRGTTFTLKIDSMSVQDIPPLRVCKHLFNMESQGTILEMPL